MSSFKISKFLAESVIDMYIETLSNGLPIKISVELRGVFNKQERKNLKLFNWYPTPMIFAEYLIIYDARIESPILITKGDEIYDYLKNFSKKFLETNEVKDMIKSVDEKYFTKSKAIVSFDKIFDKA